jgi:hypothetical protein
MRRERALKVVLVVVGLIFCGLAYPLMMFVKQEPALAMMLSVYVTLGIFLLLASRNPAANRSLIAFTAWSSFAHAMLMAGQAFANLSGANRRTMPMVEGMSLQRFANKQICPPMGPSLGPIHPQIRPTIRGQGLVVSLKTHAAANVAHF